MLFSQDFFVLLVLRNIDSIFSCQSLQPMNGCMGALVSSSFPPPPFPLPLPTTPKMASLSYCCQSALLDIFSSLLPTLLKTVENLIFLKPLCMLLDANLVFFKSYLLLEADLYLLPDVNLIFFKPCRLLDANLIFFKLCLLLDANLVFFKPYLLLDANLVFFKPCLQLDANLIFVKPCLLLLQN